MRTITDLHMHTNVSQRMCSTLGEAARAAKEAGLLAFGITDHGPKMMDGAIAHHFLCLKGLPKEIRGMCFFAGTEVNLEDYYGRVDLPESILKSLDLVITSCHVEAVSPTDVKSHTEGWLHPLDNPLVSCLGHVGNPVFQCSYGTVAKKCVLTEKLAEINSNPFPVRPGDDSNCRQVAKLCQQYQVPVPVSSDAHSCYSIGNHGAALQILEELGFPEELVINSSVERLAHYFSNKVVC